jgi:hypothetical protein
MQDGELCNPVLIELAWISYTSLSGKVLYVLAVAV